MGAAAPISLGVRIYPGFDPATLAALPPAIRARVALAADYTAQAITVQDTVAELAVVVRT